MRMMITVQLEASNLPVNGPLPLSLQFLLTGTLKINHECEDGIENPS